jgi:hypothetical protein
VASATRTILTPIRGGSAASWATNLLRELGMAAPSATSKSIALSEALVDAQRRILSISDPDAKRTSAALLASALAAVLASTSPARASLRSAVKKSGDIINMIKASAPSTKKQPRLRGLLDLCTQQVRPWISRLLSIRSTTASRSP